MEEQIYESTTPEAKITDEIWQDGERLHFESRQDVTALVEECKAQYNDGGERPRFGEGRLVARIPTALWEQLRRQGITADSKAFRDWMNHPDNRAFRTLHGVL
jgi:hypothetical protein